MRFILFLSILASNFFAFSTAQSETFRCRGKKPSPYTGVEGVRPSDTRFVSRGCNPGAPALIKAGGYVAGRNRCYNFSMNCSLAGATLTVFTRKGKRVGQARARAGCPNGRSTFDLAINATTLAQRAGNAGYLIAQMRKGNTLRCYAFRPTCARRFGQETSLDPRKYSGVDRPTGANPACGRFRAPDPIAPKKRMK